MKTHDLKIWPEYYQAILAGYKTFEARVNDRDFAVGDTLRLKEYNPVMNAFTGSSLEVKVTYLLDSPKFCAPGVVILGFRHHVCNKNLPLATDA